LQGAPYGIRALGLCLVLVGAGGCHELRYFLHASDARLPLPWVPPVLCVDVTHQRQHRPQNPQPTNPRNPGGRGGGAVCLLPVVLRGPRPDAAAARVHATHLQDAHAGGARVQDVPRWGATRLLLGGFFFPRESCRHSPVIFFRGVLLLEAGTIVGGSLPWRCFQAVSLSCLTPRVWGLELGRRAGQCGIRHPWVGPAAGAEAAIVTRYARPSETPLVHKPPSACHRRPLRHGPTPHDDPPPIMGQHPTFKPCNSATPLTTQPSPSPSPLPPPNQACPSSTPATTCLMLRTCST
jgi:hypothetical protein